MSESQPGRRERETAPPTEVGTQPRAHRTIDDPSTLQRHGTGASLPRQFGRYRIEKELGKGAMGVVYLAEDTQLGRKVALKIPRGAALEDPECLERFYREARTTSLLRHPNICPVYDVGAIDGVHYLTMAYIPGRPVNTFLGKGRLPSPKRVAAFIRKVALALEEAHRHGVVHRDLKPSNVMLDERGEPIVMDFGLAHNANTAGQARLTQSGAILGTPAYMAPEQVRGEIDQVGPRSDVYALGVMLYQFLTGDLPFSGTISRIFVQILTDPPRKPSEIRPEVDPALEAICLKMMAKDAAGRFASMKDVAAALSEYIKGAATSSMESKRGTAASPEVKVPTEPAEANLQVFPDFAAEEARRSPHRSAPGSRSRPVAARMASVASVAVALVALTIWGLSRGTAPATTSREAPPRKPGVRKVGPPTEAVPPERAVAPFDATQAKELQQAWAAHLAVPVEYRTPSGIPFRLIPPGEFLKGSPDSDPDAEKHERPQRRMTVEAFYLAEHELTVAEFRTYVESEKITTAAERGSGSWGLRVSRNRFELVPGYTWRQPGFPQKDNHPVVCVSWDEARRYCEWLGKTDIVDARLPSESEWEFACRAGTTSRFPTGDAASLQAFGNIADASILGAWPGFPRSRPYGPPVQWNDGHAFTSPAGSFPANPFGLYDMLGNVREFCGMDVRVFRGGSFSNGVTEQRSAARVATHSFPDFAIGFRAALTVDSVKRALKAADSVSR